MEHSKEFCFAVEVNLCEKLNFHDCLIIPPNIRRSFQFSSIGVMEIPVSLSARMKRRQQRRNRIDLAWGGQLRSRKNSLRASTPADSYCAAIMKGGAEGYPRDENSHRNINTPTETMSTNNVEGLDVGRLVQCREKRREH